MCNGFTTKERIYYLKGLKLLAPRPLLFFLHTNYINKYTFKDTIQGMWKLGSKHWLNNEIFTSSVLTISNSPRGSILFEYLKLPVPLRVRRL